MQKPLRFSLSLPSQEKGVRGVRKTASSVPPFVKEGVSPEKILGLNVGCINPGSMLKLPNNFETFPPSPALSPCSQKYT